MKFIPHNNQQVSPMSKILESTRGTSTRRQIRSNTTIFRITRQHRSSEVDGFAIGKQEAVRLACSRLKMLKEAPRKAMTSIDLGARRLADSVDHAQSLQLGRKDEDGHAAAGACRRRRDGEVNGARIFCISSNTLKRVRWLSLSVCQISSNYCNRNKDSRW